MDSKPYFQHTGLLDRQAVHMFRTTDTGKLHLTSKLNDQLVLGCQSISEGRLFQPQPDGTCHSAFTKESLEVGLHKINGIM